LLCQILGLDADHFWNFRQGNGAVSVIDYPKVRWFTVLSNEYHHPFRGGVFDKTSRWGIVNRSFLFLCASAVQITFISVNSELLQQVRVIDPVSGTDRLADVLIADGLIKAVEHQISDCSDIQMRDCRGWC